MNIITIVDSNWGISKEGSIPWNIEEIDNFLNDTISINKSNVIITNEGFNYKIINKKESDGEPVVFDELDSAMNYCIDNNYKVFIYGNSDLYKYYLHSRWSNVYIIQIEHNYQCDDFFPKEKLWNLTPVELREFETVDKNNQLIYGIESIKTEMNSIKLKYMKYSKNYNIINKEERNYLDVLYDLIKCGDFRQTRNAKTWSLFGKMLEFDLSSHFPLLTTKRVNFRHIFEELLFFLRGDTNVNHLADKGVHIWDKNTDRKFLDDHGFKEYKEGDMGEMYGFNFRHYGAEYKGMDEDYTGKGFDQIQYILNLLKTDKYSRRIIMTSFNPSTAHKGVLYPCHSIEVQFYVESENRLSATVYNRSQDMFLGNPYNIASAALLIYLICEVLNNSQPQNGQNILVPGRLMMFLGDCHLYENHYKQAIRQILREPLDFPQLHFNRKVKDLTDFKFEDVELIGYKSHPNIKADMVA